MLGQYVCMSSWMSSYACSLQGWTALMYAAAGVQSNKVLDILLSHGADTCARNKQVSLPGACMPLREVYVDEEVTHVVHAMHALHTTLCDNLVAVTGDHSTISMYLALGKVYTFLGSIGSIWCTCQLPPTSQCFLAECTQYLLKLPCITHVCHARPQAYC